MRSIRYGWAAVLVFFVASYTFAQPASETAQVSKLTGTSFGASPERDLRAASISAGSDYLKQLATHDDPSATVADTEVIVWRHATKAKQAQAYEKLVTDNLANAGYTYKVTNTQTTDTQTLTTFVATSTHGNVMGYWQATPNGLFLNWGHVTGGAAAALPPPPAPPAPAAAAQPAPAPAADDKDAQIAELKRKLAEMQGNKANPTPTPAAADTPAVTDAQAFTNTGVAVPALDKSDIVAKSADGNLGVVGKDGTPIEGVKLSQHDMEIASPCIQVGTDGTIHVAFIEKHKSTYAYAVYYRSSSDGGKTWTEAKNMTEDMPGFGVGWCRLVVDAQNRVYLLWRQAIKETWGVSLDPSGRGSHTNLYFRVLEGGKWSKAKPIHKLATEEMQQVDGSISYFAVADGAGHAQVIYNTTPDESHPETNNPYMYKVRSVNLGVYPGQVWQVTLDGSNASKPREIFMPPLEGTVAKKDIRCDGLEAINGYVDTAGQAHFVGMVSSYSHPMQGKTPFEAINNGKAGELITLPDLSFHGWFDPPALLVDAKGKQHVIAMYLAGEHPNIRDYTIGSDQDPDVIMNAPGVGGKTNGFQAYQGPNGRMVVVMQMSTSDYSDLGETYISTSDGAGWSQPVNVTNNAARATWATKNTGALGSVSHGTQYHALPGAVGFDKQGHMLLALIIGERGTFGSAIGGVVVASGNSETPRLFFYRF